MFRYFNIGDFDLYSWSFQIWTSPPPPPKASSNKFHSLPLSTYHLFIFIYSYSSIVSTNSCNFDPEKSYNPEVTCQKPNQLSFTAIEIIVP